MKSKFHDPNNHVPEVTPEDEWGDGDNAEQWGANSQTILPRKRAADEKSAIYRELKNDDEDKGIEIGVKVIEKSDKPAHGPVQRLEVQEHIPKLLSPEAPPPPKLVPKQVMEKPVISLEELTQEQRGGRPVEGENWGKEKHVPVRWFVITGAILAVFVITMAIFLPKMGWKDEKRAKSFFSQIEVQEDKPVVPEVKSDLDLGENVEEDAKRTIQSFSAAKSVEDVLPLIRDRERVEPGLRNRWKPMDVPANWTIPDNSEWAIRKSGKRDFGYLGGLLPDITPFHFYFVRQDGRIVLDWEASTAFSETPFAELSKGQGTGGITRGIISPADLYTFSLTEADYQCFRIMAADQQSSIWAYAKRKTPLVEQLSGLFIQGAIPREMFNEYPITVRLEKAPADSLPNQWVITEMLHIDWISP